MGSAIFIDFQLFYFLIGITSEYDITKRMVYTLLKGLGGVLCSILEILLKLKLVFPKN